MNDDTEMKELLSPLDLTEYERTALKELLVLGQMTAPDLSEATGIPKNRIYSVLEELAGQGYVKVIPGRPKKYQPKPPGDILERAVENQRQEFESYRQDITDIQEEFRNQFEPLFEQASEDITPTEELFYVVDVGEPSERETRAMYQEANEEICIITKSLEYIESIEPALADALDRGISVRILFLDPTHLDEENERIQAEIVETVRSEHPQVNLRFSEKSLPWRGSFVDPSMDYETGKAIILVEEKNIPLSLRQAAVTENGSFVAGLKRYFDLIWDFESLSQPT